MLFSNYHYLKKHFTKAIKIMTDPNFRYLNKRIRIRRIHCLDGYIFKLQFKLTKRVLFKGYPWVVVASTRVWSFDKEVENSLLKVRESAKSKRLNTINFNNPDFHLEPKKLKFRKQNDCHE